LKSDDLYSVNSFTEPRKVAPVESVIETAGRQLNLTAAAYSFCILRVKLL